MSGGGSQQTSSTTQQMMSPEQKKLLGMVTPVMSQYISPGGQVKANTYPGSTVAPVDPTTIQGQNLALGYAMGPMADTAQSALAGNSWLTSGKALDARTNPYLQSAINAAVRPISENYTQNVLGSIRDNAQLAGQYGYNRQAFEENTAAENYMKQVSDAASGLSNANYQSGLQAMSQALASEPGVMQAGTYPAQTVAAVGQQRQALQQQQIDAEVQKYYQKQFLPLSLASQIASLAFGMPGGSAVSTGTAPSNNSTLNNVLGGLGTAASIAGLVLPFV